MKSDAPMKTLIQTGSYGARNEQTSDSLQPIARLGQSAIPGSDCYIINVDQVFVRLESALVPDKFQLHQALGQAVVNQAEMLEVESISGRENLLSPIPVSILYRKMPKAVSSPQARLPQVLILVQVIVGSIPVFMQPLLGPTMPRKVSAVGWSG